MTDLWPGESLVSQWLAATAIGSLTASRTGGRLVLTDRRLVFKPMKLGEGGGLLSRTVWGLSNSISGLDDHYLALSDVVSVRAEDGASRLSVHLRTGAPRHYLIFHRRMTTVFSVKNSPYRDDAVARIGAAVAAAGD
ncbi:hypothetical protein JHN52_20480 [Streptomyces sp. MBT97]|uniref:hypothetical protein n=1 Tax=Streptomyces sp. MBT97 TaxID=2800411 RepID=UPI00190C8ECE|nr:hypothetical protein [Streptomyces sp. MBT97]MBK3635257.1 hypothetical protein [Streptomyces sp. MBT97]